MTIISLIACVGENLAIGLKNDMPWGRGLPADLAYFKKVTNGCKVIMGRNTFESILASLGKPLPNRENIVLTRDRGYAHEGATVIHSVEEVLELINPEEQVFVIGGAATYQQFLDIADVLLLTEIQESFEADSFFPRFDRKRWKEESRVSGMTNQQNPFNYDFVTYVRNDK